MTIKSFNNIEPNIAESAWVDKQALVLGSVTLAEGVSIWPMAVLRGDVQSIVIGANSNVQDGAVIHVTHDYEQCPGGMGVVVGEHVIIGHGAVVHGATIEDEVLVGMNATILDGAIIHKHVMIAAGSLVPPNKELQSGWLYAGVPVKAIRELSEKELTFFKYSAQQYVALAEQHNNSTEILSK